MLDTQKSPALRIALMNHIDQRPTGSISLPAGTKHVPFERVEILLADAMKPLSHPA
jgi:hypothetical protein